MSGDFVPIDEPVVSVRSQPAQARLRALVGGPPAARPTYDGDASAQLQALVGSSGVSRSRRGRPQAPVVLEGRREWRLPGHPANDSEPPAQDVLDGWSAPEFTRPGRRPIFGGGSGRKAARYMSVALSALVVVALAGAFSLAAYQRAAASPADDALVSLLEREIELKSELTTLRAVADAYSVAASDAVALAQSSEPVLLALRGRVSSAPLEAAEESRVALQQLGTDAPSVPIPLYSRGSVDNRSLADVAEALDEVWSVREQVRSIAAQARELQLQLSGARDSFRAELKSVGSAIQAEAAAIVAENDLAAEEIRAAVLDGAARVSSDQQAGKDGLVPMADYATAVDALRADNERALKARQAPRGSSPNTVRAPSSGGSASEYTPVLGPAANGSDGGESSDDPPSGETEGPEVGADGSGSDTGASGQTGTSPSGGTP